MIQSSEVRWFFHYEPFAPSLFFEADRSQEGRIDWYAYPCDERSGVKIREHRLEAKLLINSLGRHDFSDATGNIEHWQKWSVELPEDDFPSDAQLRFAGWVSVAKLRYLRIFANDGSSIYEVDDYPDNGGQFEWTKLTALGQKWWTIGFESFGPETELDRNLSALVNHAFEDKLIPAALETSNSFGYPKWLKQIQSSCKLP